MKLLLLFSVLTKQKQRPKIKTIEQEPNNSSTFLNATNSSNFTTISQNQNFSSSKTEIASPTPKIIPISFTSNKIILKKSKKTTILNKNSTTTKNQTFKQKLDDTKLKSVKNETSNEKILSNENPLKTFDFAIQKTSHQQQKFIELADFSTPEPTKSQIDELKRQGLLNTSPTPKPTPKATPSSTSEPTPMSTPEETPEATLNIVRGVVRGKGKRIVLPPPPPTPYPTKTPTPRPTPTASDVPKEEEEDPDEMIEENMQRIVPERDRKIAVIGVQRLRPTQSKTPSASWDEFLSKTSTSIYLGLVGFVIGAIYAWYAFILSPSNEPIHIPAIFKSQGVDLEEIEDTPPPKPRAY